MNKNKLGKKANPAIIPTSGVLNDEDSKKTSTGTTPVLPDTSSDKLAVGSGENGAVIEQATGDLEGTGTATSTVLVEELTGGEDGGVIGLGEGSSDTGNSIETLLTGGETGTPVPSEDAESETILTTDPLGVVIASGHAAATALTNEPNYMGVKLYWYPALGKSSIFHPISVARDVTDEDLLQDLLHNGQVKIYSSPHAIKCGIDDPDHERLAVARFEQEVLSQMKLRRR